MTGEWGDSREALGPDWGDSTDQGCKSVMLAIQSFNNYKTANLEYKTSVSLRGPQNLHRSYTTPPLPLRGFWTYPRTKSNGDSMLPLVTRQAGSDLASDVFGNKVQPSDTALFPERFHSQFRSIAGSEDGYQFNPCWLEDVKPLVNCADYGLLPSYYGTCNETSTTSYSTIWWALPLSRPTATSSGTEISTTAPSTSISSTPNKVAASQGRQVITQAICLSCTTGTDSQAARITQNSSTYQLSSSQFLRITTTEQARLRTYQPNICHDNNRTYPRIVIIAGAHFKPCLIHFIISDNHHPPSRNIPNDPRPIRP